MDKPMAMIALDLNINLATYECPICRSVGSISITKPGDTRIPQLIECPVCQSLIVISRTTTHVDVHYSLPVKSING